MSNVYDKVFQNPYASLERKEPYTNYPPARVNPRQQDWAHEYAQYGSSKIPTSAELPTTSFTFPESQASRLNPHLARCTFIFFKTTLSGVMRLLPVIFDSSQHHFHNQRYMQARPLPRLPEESTPPTTTLTDEAVSARSERYGMGRYAELNFDATPEGAQIREAYLKNFVICVELTIHAYAMVRLLGCRTLYHAYFEKQCKSAFTADNLKLLMVLQNQLFGCVYYPKKFRSMLATAFNVFPEKTAMNVMITSQKALPLLQEGVMQRAMPIDESVRYFLQAPALSETFALDIPTYGSVELYADYNEESDRGEVNPDYLFRKNVAKGQYAIFDIPYKMDPAKYTPAMRNIEVCNYRIPAWDEVEFGDAILYGMPDDFLYDTSSSKAGRGKKANLDSAALGYYLAFEFSALEATEDSTSAKETFFKGILFCGRVLMERWKTLMATPSGALLVCADPTAQIVTVVDYKTEAKNIAPVDLPLRDAQLDTMRTKIVKKYAANSASAGQLLAAIDAMRAACLPDYYHPDNSRDTRKIGDADLERALVAAFEKAIAGIDLNNYDPLIPEEYRLTQTYLKYVPAVPGTGMHFEAREKRNKKKRHTGELNVVTRKPFARTEAQLLTESADLLAALRSRDSTIPIPVWQLLFSVEMKKANLAKLHAFGVCLPLQIYMVRPEMRFTATSYILGVPGIQTGYTWLVGSSFAEGMNAKNQTTASSFAIELGCMIKQPKNIGVLPDVEINRLDSGHGLNRSPNPESFDPDTDDVLFFATGLSDAMDKHFAIPANGNYADTTHMMHIGTQEGCTTEGFVSSLTQLLYGRNAAGDVADFKDVHTKTSSVIMKSARTTNEFMEVLEGTDTPENFHTKWENTLQHCCFQMHQRMPSQNREILGRSALREYEDPARMYSEYVGNFVRDEEPIPIRHIHKDEPHYSSRV
jgi:hypothetical protein